MVGIPSSLDLVSNYTEVIPDKIHNKVTARPGYQTVPVTESWSVDGLTGILYGLVYQTFLYGQGLKETMANSKINHQPLSFFVLVDDSYGRWLVT